jgi:hypothetical protein
LRFIWLIIEPIPENFYIRGAVPNGNFGAVFNLITVIAVASDAELASRISGQSPAFSLWAFVFLFGPDEQFGFL